MAKKSQLLQQRTVVREIHLEHLKAGLTDLQEYERALVIFRFRGAVVGQAWLPVKEGYISASQLRAKLPKMAWPIWQRLMAPSDSSQPLPTASVVVCTRNRTADLARCLPGLAQLAAQNHEVIVVDNCPSDDSTARLVANYPAIRYLYEPRLGLDIARNRGLQIANSEIVAFTDDDAQVDMGWLSALLRNFDDPMVAVVTGITMPLELETEAQLWFEWTNGFGRGFVRKQFDVTTINVLGAGMVGAGVNMAIRRNILDQVGWFDEALDGGTASLSGGDQEFFYRVMARGYRIVYEPAALVWHRHRREWSALRRTVYSYGVGLFAWWMRCLLVEKEVTLLKHAPSWFWQYHVRNLLRALLRRPDRVPFDLAWAEFRGALAGPGSYLRSRRMVQQQMQTVKNSPTPPLINQRPSSIISQHVEVP